MGVIIIITLNFPKHAALAQVHNNNHHQQRSKETKDDQQDDHLINTDENVKNLGIEVNELQKQVSNDEFLVKGVSIAISILYTFGFIKKKEQS